MNVDFWAKPALFGEVTLWLWSCDSEEWTNDSDEWSSSSVSVSSSSSSSSTGSSQTGLSPLFAVWSFSYKTV